MKAFTLIALTCSLLSPIAALAQGEAAASTSAASDQAASAAAEPQTAPSNLPRVALETSMGTIVVELDTAQAPLSSQNFLQYVDDGFYSGTVFHRVIPGFMIQGGGVTADLKKKETREAIRNEADNGLRNVRGSLALARTGDPHSATSQFYINLADNNQLDHAQYVSRGGWGYTVFGKVVEGMEVVDAIAAVKTSRQGVHANAPVEVVTILGARRVE